MSTAQYRVSLAKKEELVHGPDNADVIITVAAKDADLDPTLAFMWGKLKSEGSTGALLDELISGRAREVLTKLVAEA